MTNTEKEIYMRKYLPEVFSVIEDVRGVIFGESKEFVDSDAEAMKVLDNSYIDFMDEATVIKWEKWLQIVLAPDSTLSDRKETIKGMLYPNNKLNTETIDHIVKIFTGYEAISYFKNSTLSIKIKVPLLDRRYQFSNVEKELKKRSPSHITVIVTRNYYTWELVKEPTSGTTRTWATINSNYSNWEDILLDMAE